jgi:predicted PurR-regulated permease PerM
MPDTSPFPPEPTAHATRAQSFALGTASAVLLALGLWTLRDFLPALVWAAILAVALWPLYRRLRMESRGNLMPALFSVAVALLFVLPLALLLMQVARDGHTVYDWLQHARHDGIPVPGWVSHLPAGGEIADWWQANLSDPAGASDLLSRVDRGGLLQQTRNVGGQLLHRLVLFAFTILTLFFLFRDGPELVAQMLLASRRAFGPRGERVGRQIIASVHGTVDGLVLVGLGEGILLGIGYHVAGVPHPTLLGAVTAVGAMIPFAVILVYGGAALFLLAQGSIAWAIGLFIVGSVVVFVSDHFVRPALIGGATHLPFIWVLLGILGGVEVWGLLGLFVGPAIMAALMLLWREWVSGEVG